MSNTGKTLTYLGEIYPVHKDSSGEYIVVDSDVRRVYAYLDTLSKIGVPIEYDRPPFEELEDGAYSVFSGTLAYSHIYQKARGEWVEANTSQGVTAEVLFALKENYEKKNLGRLVFASEEQI